MSVLSEWVEHGKAPNRIVASRVTAGHADHTRPLCPYPQEARWTGRGSTDEAANFACAASDGAAPENTGAWLKDVQAASP